MVEPQQPDGLLRSTVSSADVEPFGRAIAPRLWPEVCATLSPSEIVRLSIRLGVEFVREYEQVFPTTGYIVQNACSMRKCSDAIYSSGRYHCDREVLLVRELYMHMQAEMVAAKY